MSTPEERPDASVRRTPEPDRSASGNPASGPSAAGTAAAGKAAAGKAAAGKAPKPAPVRQPVGAVRFMTVAEVAATMRVSKMTVYRMVHNGEIAAVRVGRSFRVPENAVHDYLENAFIETA